MNYSQNIKFCYLYRDAGNYKNYGEIIFAGHDTIDIKELENLIRLRLIDHLWFYAKNWGIQELYFDKYDGDLDHGFHEFESVLYTNECFNSELSILDFHRLIKESNWKY